MMINPAMKAYQSVAQFALSGRDADAACFRMLIEELEAADAGSDQDIRRAALSKNQRLWSMIMKANTLDTGVTSLEDRELFVTLADRSQRYGIRAILDPNLSLLPLIEIARNVLDGLEPAPVKTEEPFDLNGIF